MHAFNVAAMHVERRRAPSLRLMVVRSALAALLALAAVPLSHAAVCSMDIDGNGRLEATTDGLLMTRYLLGLRGTALVTGALGTGATRTLPIDIEKYLAKPCAQAGWVGQGSGRLNDTGITFGGDPISGNNSTCASTGANIAQQDCSKGRDANPALNMETDGDLGFSFTKISNSGGVLPASAFFGSGVNDWACTYDNVTGLMWEVKTASGPRSSAHTYSWTGFDASNNAGSIGSAGGGVCVGSGACDTEGFVYFINANAPGLCGRTDWRMPHVKELESITHLGYYNPSLDPDWFPNSVGEFFWSGSPVSGLATSAWGVNFSSGNAYYDSRSFASRVRLVRSGL